MARQAQSSQPTVRQALSAGGQLQSPIRAGGLYSYDEARAGYVGRAAADVSLGNLVASLSHLDSSLMRNFQAVMDRKIERDVAAGRVAFEENRGENKNRLDWKAASEANPELQKLNPYAVRGYEEARQQSLAHADNIEAATFAFTTLLNEKDPRAREEKLNDFYAAQRAANGMEGYQDKLLLAQNCTAIAAQGKMRLLAGLEERQAQQRIQDLALQHADLAVKELESLSHPALGGIDLDDPEQEETNSGTIIGVVSRQMRNASLNGVPDSKIPELTLDTYLTAYRKSGNTLYLEAAKRQEINGKKLINMPGVADKLEAIDRERLTRARADWQFARTVEAENIKKAERGMSGLIYTAVRDGKAVDDAFLAASGIPEFMRADALLKAGQYADWQQKARLASPAGRDRAVAANSLARMGLMSVNEAGKYYAETGDKGPLDLALKAEDEEYQLRAKMLKEGANKMFQMFGKTRGESDISTIFNNIEAMDTLGRQGYEASLVFIANYDAAFEKFKEKKQRLPNEMEATSLSLAVQADTQKQMSAYFASVGEAEMTGQPVPPSPRAQAQETPPVDRIPQHMLESLKMVFPKDSDLIGPGSSMTDLQRFLERFPPEARQEFENVVRRQIPPLSQAHQAEGDE